MHTLHPIWKKLQYKGQKQVLLTGVPSSFAEVTEALPAPTERTLEAPFLLHFCITQDQLNTAAEAASKLPEGDVMVWVAYPKKSSKQYTCEFDRDHGWEAFGSAGFEGVRMVAIDANWSALRMRRTGFIQSMKRRANLALSPEGKRRTADN